MKIIFSISLLCAFYGTLVSAFSRDPYLPSISRQLPSATHNAGEPLFLTPLIEAGKLNEARNQSRVPPLLNNIESYSGFLTVNKTSKSHLFFWFITKTGGDYSSAPVIVWLQGGPGCSSLFGLFSENGPFKVTKDGLKERPYAWTDHYNMLYIDQPVDVGYSFSEGHGYVNTEEEVGEHLYALLVQFYRVFTEFKHEGLYIAGESYAGKYVPAVGYKIHTANREPTNTLKLPLRGLLYGNGFSDPENQQGWRKYLYNAGLIDSEECAILQKTEDQMIYAIRSGEWLSATQHDRHMRVQTREFLDTISLYDYTRDNYPGFDDSFVEFVTRDDVRKGLHVGQAKYDLNSEQVGNDFYIDFSKSVRPWIEELLEHYPMLFYNGQFDLVCAHPFTENFLNRLHWSGATEFGFAKRKIWKVGNMVAGYTKVAGNLVDVMVRNAGHNVPTDQPKNTLALIDMFIEKRFNVNSTKSGI